MQVAVAIILVSILLLSAILFGRSQLQTLRWLRTSEHLPSEDRTYFRRRAYRRLIGCGLMAVLAVLISGLFTFGILDSLDEVIARGRADDQQGQLTPDEEAAVRQGLTYVGGIALVLFLLLALALLDMMALRRYGMRHRKRIRDDRQAMLERQLPLLRQSHHERNGEASK